MDIQKEQVITFFEEKIIKYILGDLDVLDTIQPDTHENTCSIPTAMLILSSMDLIGYLLRSTGKLNETEENIYKALEYFPSEYQNYKEQLVINFRHGMMHNFFPKNYQGEFYTIHKYNNDELFVELSLNVNRLSKDFRYFVNKIIAEIKSNKQDDMIINIQNAFKDAFIKPFPLLSRQNFDATSSNAILRNK